MKVLLQTTMPFDANDWHVGRFSMLADHLRRSVGAYVLARNRTPDGTGIDNELLMHLGHGEFDQVWVIAADKHGENGLLQVEVAGLREYSARGGGLLLARDHENLGACLVEVGVVGKAHHFHDENPCAEEDHLQRDDPENDQINWPNFHTGSNGDVQVIKSNILHPVLEGVRLLLAHPHEGDIGVPPNTPEAEVVMMGTSVKTGREFPLAIAFERTLHHGRAWAESSFHHFADYNMDPRAGCPTSVIERPSFAVVDNPQLLTDTRQYIKNLALWLDPPRHPVA